MPTGNFSTFCAMPWFHLMASNQGKISPCCIAEVLPGVDLPERSSDLDTVRNSDAFLLIRKQILNGERPNPCKVCFETEDRGLKSARNIANEKFSTEVSDLQKTLQSETLECGRLLSADFRIENLCNLKCRMCGPENSKILTDEWSTLQLSWGNNSPLYSWKTDEEWSNFFRSNPKLEYLTLAGGEPFLTPRVLWIVDFLISNGLAPNINICFHTNLTKFPHELVSKLSNFRTVKIMVSIEGPARINSYIRHQSNWKSLELNFQRLDAFSKFPFVKSNFSITVQAYNILHLDEFLEFSGTLINFDPPNLSILTTPKELHFAVLPQKFRLVAAKKLERILPRLKSLFENSEPQAVSVLSDQVKNLILRLHELDFGEHLSAFVYRTQAMDHYRNQSILDTHPEFAELFPKRLCAPVAST